MGIATGHRNGGVPLAPGKRHGINQITNRHGIPFYKQGTGSSGTSIKRQGETAINFNLSGNLSGQASVKSPLMAAELFRFLLSGNLSKSVTSHEAQLLKTYGITINFFNTGELRRKQKLSGFSQIQFDVPGTIAAARKQYNRAGVSWITLDVQGNLIAVPVQLGYGLLYNWYCISSIKWGYLYNKYAAQDSRYLAADGWRLPNGTDLYYMARPLIDGHSDPYPEAGTAFSSDNIYDWQGTIYGTNSSGYNGKGTGSRAANGGFGNGGYGQESFWDSYGTIYKWWLNNGQYAPYAYAVTNNGCSIRFVKDSTTLSEGEFGTYTGNDGRVYKTKCINGVETMVEYLAETKYRNGDLIPVVPGNYAWSVLTTGARCAYNLNEDNAFRNIAPAGWHIPTHTELQDLVTYVGSGPFNKLREIGVVYWSMSGGTNDFSFNARGSGRREYWNGAFALLRADMYLWCKDTLSGYPYGMYLWQAPESVVITSFYHREGHSVRPIKDSTSLSDGQAGTVTDIDGNTYPTICIGTQEWFASNLKVTKYNDGTPIPEVTDNDEWAALTDGALCAYNNDHNNI